MHYNDNIGSELAGKMRVNERWNEPIFIVGSPRSGTTLMRNMLNRHPAIAIYREADFHHYIYRRRRSFGNLGDLGNRRRLVKEYLSIGCVTRMRMDLQALEATLLEEGVTYQAFFLSLLRFFARAHGKSRCGEKTPRHAQITQELCQWYPDAHIIHVVRDPRDVVASFLNMPWADHNVLGNAHLWMRYNRAAQRSRHHPKYLLVHYEQLVTQPEQELRHICASVGEDYSPAMLVPKHDPTTDRFWMQRAEEAVSTARLGKWRDQLTADQVAVIEWLVDPYMQTLGYKPVGPRPSKVTIARALASAAFDVARRHAGEFPGMWYYLTCSTQLAKEEAARARFRSRQLGGAEILTQ